MESNIIGVGYDLEQLFISKILSIVDTSSLDEVQNIYEIQIPLFLSCKIFEDCLLIISIDYLTIVYIDNIEKIIKIPYHAWKWMITSKKKTEEVIISYTEGTGWNPDKNQILIKHEHIQEILEQIAFNFYNATQSKIKIYKCNFTNLNLKRNLEYLNLTHGNWITTIVKIRKEKKYSLEDYEFIKYLWETSGRKVLLVRNKHNKKWFAIKAIHKYNLINQGCVYWYIEKFIWENFNNNFLLQDEFSFQTRRNIYIVSPYVQVDLYSWLKNKGRFNETDAAFIAINIGLGLQALHEYKIAYRDWKPENILINEDGFIWLCDFGWSVLWYPSNKAYTWCGTPQYFAPEIIVNNSHDERVDWWSFGILLYELLCGYTPFIDENTYELYSKIINDEVDYPDDLSVEVKDLLDGLLCKDPEQRLGRNQGWDEICEHDFFKKGKWNICQVKGKAMESPLLRDLEKWKRRGNVAGCDGNDVVGINEDNLFVEEKDEEEMWMKNKELFLDFD